MHSGVDPKGDFIFKRLFGTAESAALRHALLNDVLRFPSTKAVRETTLLNPAIDPDLAGEKVSILDIRLTDQAGRWYYLEMQRKVVPWVFAKRALYYWAQLYSRQLRTGETHHTLAPTFGLCFLDEPLVSDDQVHHVFQVTAAGGVLLAPDLTIHTVELSKFRLAADELTTGLDRWCYFLKHGAELDPDKLPATLDVPAIRQALEVLMKVSQDIIDFHTQDERMKWKRDFADLEYAAKHGEELARKYAEEQAELAAAAALRKGLEDGKKEGLKEGIKEGIKEGRDTGELIGTVHAYQRLLKQPLTPKEELYSLPTDALRQLAADLQARLVPPANGAPS